MYVASTARAVVTSPEVGIACCLTSLDDVTDETPEVTDFHLSGAVLLLVAHGAVFALSVTGNAIVLYVIGRHLGYRTATNVYITTLCVADVATALVCLPLAGAAVTLSRWSIGGEATCVAYDVLRRSLSLLSTSMTTALVVDRYMTVVRLRRVQTVIQRTLITVAALVTFSVLASLPWYLIVTAISTMPALTSWSWPPLCLPQYIDTAIIYDVVYAAVMSGLPAVGLACCAARVLRAVLRSTSVVRPSTSGAGQLLFQDELKTATTVILLVGVFTACRCVHCVMVCLSACTSLRAGELGWRMNSRILLDSVAALAITANGAVNPAVYALRNPNVARVLRLGRQQRYGGYVADDTASTSAAHVAATVTTTHREVLDRTLSDSRSGTEQRDEHSVESHVPRGEVSDSTKNSTKMIHVVPVDNARQQTDQRSWSVDFGTSRRTSSSFSAPSVICSVTSRRKSSLLSNHTTSTLTSVVH